MALIHIGQHQPWKFVGFSTFLQTPFVEKMTHPVLIDEPESRIIDDGAIVDVSQRELEKDLRRVRKQ